MRLLVLLVLLFESFVVLANKNDGVPVHEPTLADFGGVGILQTPTARMYAAGGFGVYRKSTAPYTWEGLVMQPLDWFEGNIRYMDISNRSYDPRESFSTLSRKDKAIDFKIRLKKESYVMPEISVGFIDGGGTGLFASEYIAGTKRFGNIDATLGVGFGYMADGGQFDNPLSYVLGNKYNVRPGYQTHGITGGNFSVTKYFRGRPALFGGFEYQTAWKPLILKVEIEANSYANEPLLNPQPQNSRINMGALFRINDSLDFNVAFERGNTFMFGFALHENLSRMKSLFKRDDPAPVALVENNQPTAELNTDWHQVASDIQQNSGYRVHEIGLNEHEIVMRGTQERYFSQTKGTGRAARILNNNVGTDVEWLTIVDELRGVPSKAISLKRSVFDDAIHNDIELEVLHRTSIEAPDAEKVSSVVYKEKDPQPFRAAIGLGYKQVVGGPDAFILYRFSADLSAAYYFRENFWWNGMLSTGVVDNFDLWKFNGWSNLPKVRTDLRRYLVTSNVQMPIFQFNYTQQLSENVYSLFYGGMLEFMYGGVGGEVLYRPFGETWAVGYDLNFIKQRAYEQNFNLEKFAEHSPYTTNITTYWQPNYGSILDGRLQNYLEGMFFSISYGRYLARDTGATLAATRIFKNGATMGAWATFTNVSQEQFGEGSFDKGIYFSIPWDMMLTTSIQGSMNFAWRPLTRDGGAKLIRSVTLYGITSGRDLKSFRNDFDRVLE